MDNCLHHIYQFLTSNSNFETTSDLLNFLFPSILLIPWEKLFFPQIKYTQNLSKSYKIVQNVDICGMRREIFECLKHERGIYVKNIIHSQNMAFMLTSALSMQNFSNWYSVIKFTTFNASPWHLESFLALVKILFWWKTVYAENDFLAKQTPFKIASLPLHVHIMSTHWSWVLLCLIVLTWISKLSYSTN